ncbi:DUF3964 family protein [Listeria ivanovii]|uniref:DUF3964 domain-containing protein n=1 Tax=Listeria ivanovii (strain ATCC BAA-678 / PAM 55) TaxID=881621 RepID=G2ZCU7_LISIP|nr:DUF3964 family protein [Listeria ivanovii]AHI55203.1 hypothetical protein AX25_03470 [Listeria ivanovii WSLC3009]AIS64658.1 hypothetical protein JL52_03405 [Listeria ivanovii subsp. ivanovii]MBC1758647.1 DUF3964 family protein [Listeria ivanovii]MBK3913521.1 DUF3964 family protein [Listeria ivanovii subsp. ivanovii]MBK3920361.1 DUF3964 family protein [Listeria ivanovii subsp. ivanovii]
MGRMENIKNLAFFEDKPNLAEQILALEKREQLFLPNEFEIRQTTGYQIGEKEVILGRLESFYFLALKGIEEDTYRSQAFASEADAKAFFVHLPEMENELVAFWLNEVELVR